MKWTTADDPSAARMSAAVATPRAANDTAPITTAAASDPAAFGRGVPYATRPSTISATVWIAKTTSVDASVAAMYVAVGSGVARIRFRIPLSRRAASWVAGPAEGRVRRP